MNPNPQKCRELANMFEKLNIAKPDAEVRMMCTTFSKCGTLACHAGWFAVANGKTRSLQYDFRNAATDMGEFLGIPGDRRLEKWAEENPLLWGNHNGDSMFCDSIAFGKKYDELTLADIGAHWRGVADRIEGVA